MTPDSQTARVLAAAKAGPLSKIEDLVPEQIRAFDVKTNPPDQDARARIQSSVDISIPGQEGDIPARVYFPTEETGGLILYFHGGGHVIGSYEVFDGFSCLLSAESGATVVSVDYRLAPEHRFPAGLNDCYAAYCWAVEHFASEFGRQVGRIAVIGDSAGGAMAAGVTFLARRDGRRMPDFQALIYPMLAGDRETESRRRNGEGFLVTRAMISYYMELYAARPEDASDPLFAPSLQPDLTGLPPALIITADLDPLRDEGESYARRLRTAGVDVIYTCYGGTIHGFVKRYREIDKGRAAISQVATTVRLALQGGWST